MLHLRTVVTDLHQVFSKNQNYVFSVVICNVEDRQQQLKDVGLALVEQEKEELLRFIPFMTQKRVQRLKILLVKTTIPLPLA